MLLTVAVSFDSKLKFGDLLTSFSVLISASALFYAWTKDRALRRREQANAVRTAAAEALAKLTRWGALQGSLADDVQDLVISTSELLEAERDVGAARDDFWKGLDARRREVVTQQRKEDIESAYVRLYGSRPEAFEWFEGALARLRAAADEEFASLKLDAQSRILAFENRLDDYQPALLGDELRSAVTAYERCLEDHLGTVLGDARRRLGSIIEAADEEVLDRSWRPLSDGGSEPAASRPPRTGR